MIRLTDVDGDPVLVQEHFIMAVVTYRLTPEEKTGLEPVAADRPKSLVMIGDKGFAVLETVEEIDTIVRLGDLPGGGRGVRA
jgi:hypothetical protein